MHAGSVEGQIMEDPNQLSVSTRLIRRWEPPAWTRLAMTLAVSSVWTTAVLQNNGSEYQHERNGNLNCLSRPGGQPRVRRLVRFLLDTN